MLVIGRIFVQQQLSDKSQDGPVRSIVRSPMPNSFVSWLETGERKIFGPDLVTEAEEKVKTIQNNLKAAQSRQKSYTDI
jgi:hypothetical protein